MRTRKFFQDLGSEIDSLGPDVTRRLESLDAAPALVRRFIRWKTVRTMKRDHYCQIVPIEDVERIFEFVNSIIRVACLCRHLTLGEEKRFCYGISMGPGGGRLPEIMKSIDSSFFDGPDAACAEIIGREERSCSSGNTRSRASVTASGPSRRPSSAGSATATAPTAWPCRCR